MERSRSHSSVGAKYALAGEQMFADHGFIQLDAKSGSIGDSCETPFNQRFFEADYQVFPPGYINAMMFQRDHVLRCSRAVDVSQEGDRRAGEVHGHADTVLFGVIADFLGLEDTSRSGQIGMNEVDRVSVNEFRELFFEVDILSGECRKVDGAGDLPPEIGVLPGYHVLEPGQLIGRECPAQANCVVHGEVTEVVGGKWHFVANGVTNGGNVFDKTFYRPVCQLDRSKRMGGHPVTSPVEAERGRDQSPFPLKQVDTQIHLEEGKSGVEPGLHSVRYSVRSRETVVSA